MIHPKLHVAHRAAARALPAPTLHGAARGGARERGRRPPAAAGGAPRRVSPAPLHRAPEQALEQGARTGGRRARRAEGGRGKVVVAGLAVRAPFRIGLERLGVGPVRGRVLEAVLRRAGRRIIRLSSWSLEHLSIERVGGCGSPKGHVFTPGSAQPFKRA